MNYCISANCKHEPMDGSHLCYHCYLDVQTITGPITTKAIKSIGADRPDLKIQHVNDVGSISVQANGELSGGDVNYYLLDIMDPKRLKSYTCEAEDIIEALGMTFAEGNVFKALWRSCAMRVRGHGKQGADKEGIYDGDKIAYYGERIKVQRRRKSKRSEK